MYCDSYKFFLEWRPYDFQEKKVYIALVFKWTPNILKKLTLREIEYWGAIAEKVISKGGLI